MKSRPTETALPLIALIAFALAMSSTSLVRAGLDDGLVGYWKYDEGAGTVAHDATGNAHDGSFRGSPSWVAGKSGYALSFDGADDGVDVPNVNGLNFDNQSVTFAAWIKLAGNAGSNSGAIITLMDSDSYPAIMLGQRGWAGGLFLQVQTNSPGTWCTVDSSQTGNALPKNQWLHLAGVIDVAHNQLLLYYNGRFDRSATSCSYNFTEVTHLYLAHGYNPRGYNPFRGVMDEVRIYSRALSAQEVLALYGTPPPDALLGPQENSGRTNDPVNTATGNLTRDELDLSIATRGPWLGLRRFYNSADTRTGPLGPGWGHSYFVVLNPTAPNSQVSVRWDDGQTAYWMSNGAGGYTPALAGIYDQLVHNGNGTWTVTKKNRDVYQFDSSGRLVSVTDKNANTLSLAYGAPAFPDRVTAVTDPAGRTLTFSYNGSGLLEQVTDFGSPPRAVQYSYTSGRLTGVTDATSGVIAYAYDGSGRLETVTDQRGVVTVHNVYDGQGRVIEQRDGNNNITQLAYDTPTAGQTRTTQTVTIDGQPHQIQSIHTHEGAYKQLKSITDSLGHVISYTYTGDDRDSITDRNGKTTRFTYDARGNVLTTTEPDNPADPNDGGVTSVAYTDTNCPDVPTRKTDGLGFVTDWTYDVHCNVLTEKRYLDLARTLYVSKSWTYNTYGQRLTEANERGYVHQWIYGADGRLTEEIDRAGNHTWYGYDAYWRRTSLTDGRGSGPSDPAHTTTYTYDAADRLLSTTGPPVGSPAHQISHSFQYDAIGNRTHLTDGRGNTTRSFYDNNSNLIRVEEPLNGNPQGRVTQFSFDQLNRKISMTDANGHVATYRYDDADRLVEQRDAENDAWTYTYDAQGNVLTETDPSGVTVAYEYDSMNRKTVVRDKLTNEWLTQYDKLGHVTRKTDARAKETDYTYDALGRLTCVVDPGGGWTEYRYDAAGNLTEIEDANNHVVSRRTYDAVNRLIRSEDGIGYFYQYGYDPVGNQTQVIDAKLLTTTLTYDAEDRLKTVSYPDATHVVQVYDDNGNRTVMVDPNGASSFTYDELNRLRSSVDSNGSQVQYGYDPVGNRTSLTYPDGKVVSYGYDGANRLTTITDWASRATGYTYDGTRIATVTYPNGVVETRGYDAAGRLTSKSTADSLAQGLLSLAWVRDGEGNPTVATETGTLQPLGEGADTSCQYDADNRLTSSTHGIYQHDPNGNLLSRTLNGVTTNFSYDVEDRLVFQATGGNTTQHVYDGDGNRIARIEGSAATNYVLDRGRSMSHVLCETDIFGHIVAYYIHGPELVGRIGSGWSQRYYHTNDIGTVLALTDETGQISDRYGYSPFGVRRGREGTTPNPFTYVGGLGVMEDTGDLYFMRARFYDANAGRFLKKDPVPGLAEEPASLHEYVYAENMPGALVDPQGTVAKGNPVLLNTSIPFRPLIVTTKKLSMPVGVVAERPYWQGGNRTMTLKDSVAHGGSGVSRTEVLVAGAKTAAVIGVGASVAVAGVLAAPAIVAAIPTAAAVKAAFLSTLCYLATSEGVGPVREHLKLDFIISGGEWLHGALEDVFARRSAPGGGGGVPSPETLNMTRDVMDNQWSSHGSSSLSKNTPYIATTDVAHRSVTAK